MTQLSQLFSTLPTTITANSELYIYNSSSTLATNYTDWAAETNKNPCTNTKFKKLSSTPSVDTYNISWSGVDLSGATPSLGDISFSPVAATNPTQSGAYYLVFRTGACSSNVCSDDEILTINYIAPIQSTLGGYQPPDVCTVPGVTNYRFEIDMPLFNITNLNASNIPVLTNETKYRIALMLLVTSQGATTSTTASCLITDAINKGTGLYSPTTATANFPILNNTYPLLEHKTVVAGNLDFSTSSKDFASAVPNNDYYYRANKLTIDSPFSISTNPSVDYKFVLYVVSEEFLGASVQNCTTVIETDHGRVVGSPFAGTAQPLTVCG